MAEEVEMLPLISPLLKGCLVCNQELKTKNKRLLINCVTCEQSAHRRCLMTNKSIKQCLKSLKDKENPLNWITYQCMNCKIIVAESVKLECELKKCIEQHELQKNEINVLNQQIVNMGYTHKKSIPTDDFVSTDGFVSEASSVSVEKNSHSLINSDVRETLSTGFVNTDLQEIQIDEKVRRIKTDVKNFALAEKNNYSLTSSDVKESSSTELPDTDIQKILTDE